ncbi:MAG TPA: class II aldolase/adducin family protein, partial [Methanothrix soehngenii]|nr:class II aldolase/adducin family protein [Methanothrix soehngenii]
MILAEVPAEVALGNDRPFLTEGADHLGDLIQSTSNHKPLRIGINGQPLENGKKPSIETPMHIAAYRHSDSVSAVIHMHSPCVTAFALARQPIETRYAPFAHLHLGNIGYVKYSTPGGAAFHEEVAA